MYLKRFLLYNCFLLVILVLLNILKLPSYPVENLSSVKPNTGVMLTPQRFQRPLNATLLTYPEWYLVYSPDEYGRFIADHFPNQFPFFEATWQYWDSYYKANQVIAPLHVSNAGDQVMLIVIGGSTTVEYFLRGLYEKTIGTFSAKVSGRVSEDDYAAKVTDQYVLFIEKEPWYAFDFWGSLRGLWLDNSFFGHGVFRKMERKYILTTEYGVKAIYGQLIGWATYVGYGVASVQTAVLVQSLPPTFSPTKPGVSIENKNLKGNVLLLVPRLTAFEEYAKWLAANHIQFKEIAGNNSFIAMSVLVPQDWRNPYPGSSILFKQNILTQPGQQRVMLTVPVNELSQALNVYQGHVNIEHIYDY